MNLCKARRTSALAAGAARVEAYRLPAAALVRTTSSLHMLLATQHPGLLDGWVFPNGVGKPRANGSLCDANRRVLAHAGITKRVTIHGLRRTATDLLRRAAVDPVAAKAIIGHTTDRMREHDSTVNAEETRHIGTRVASLVPAVRLARGR